MLIFIGGMIGIISLFIGSVLAIGLFEGAASIILLAFGVVGFGVVPLSEPRNPKSFLRAIGIAFFALMGASIDQPGNYLYNKPVELCFCGAGTSLDRKEDISHPLPGSTYIQQDFTCYDATGEPVKRIHMLAVAGIRFIEYVLLAYLLLAIRRVLWSLKH